MGTELLLGDIVNTNARELSAALRDALVTGSGGEQLISGAEKSAGSLAARYSNAQLLTMVEAVEDITTALALHANKNLTLSRLVCRLAAGM